MPPHVFIASSTFAEYDDSPLKIIKDSGLTITVNSTKKRLDQQQLIAQAQGADAVIAGLEVYDAQVLEHLEKLRCISRCGVGVDNIDLTTAQKKGIKIFTTPKVVVQPVVELTLGMILDLLRKITEHTVLMRQGQWQRLAGEQLAGKTVGVIGLGQIGRRVAEILVQMEAHVIGHDLYPDQTWAQKHGITIVDLKQILRASDILTLHLSSSLQNPFLLTEQHFQSMKQGALIVNVSRGIFLDEAALVKALQEGHLAGAALDVFAQEPYNGPLTGLHNVILTPHVGTLTKQARVQMEVQAVENAIHFLKI